MTFTSTMVRPKCRPSLVILSLAAIAVSSVDAEAGNVPGNYSFQGLGKTNTGQTWQAAAISDVSEGPLVIVGARGLGLAHGVRWTQNSGADDLGQSRASDVSADGSVIVGGFGEAYRWTAEGVDMLGSLGGTNQSIGLGVSRDGTLVVGHTTNDSGGQAFMWDANNPQLGMQGLPNQLLSDGITEDVDNAGYEVDRDSAGNIWVSGKTASPQAGVTASIQAAIWKNGQPVYRHQVLLGSETAAMAMTPNSSGGSATEPRFVFNESRTPTSSTVAVYDDSTPPLENPKEFVDLDIPLDPVVNLKLWADDISTDGSIVVGRSRANFQKAVIFQVDTPVWGNFETRFLDELLMANMQPSALEALDLANWQLQTTVGVTVGEQFVPSLGVNLYTSVIVGNGLDPNGVTMPWTATVQSVPDLEAESLARIAVPGGTFESGGSEWTVLGDGTFDLIVSPAGDGMAGQLTTETEISISQLIDTPNELFILAMDLAFLSPTGSMQVSLDGTLLGEFSSTEFLGNEFPPVPMLVSNPDLFGRTDIELKVSTFGGSTGQVVFDNISIATAVVPEPSSFLLTLLAALPLFSFRRRLVTRL